MHMQESSQVRMLVSKSPWPPLVVRGHLHATFSTGNEILPRIQEQEAGWGNIDVPSDIRSNCEVDPTKVDVPLAY